MTSGDNLMPFGAFDIAPCTLFLTAALDNRAREDHTLVVSRRDLAEWQRWLNAVGAAGRQSAHPRGNGK